MSCGSGKYVSSDRTQCITCEAGYKCTGDGSKVACGAGTYQPSTGKSSCITCPAGYTCSGASQTLCPAGSYSSSAGSTSCTTCPQGYYCTGGSNLSACWGGTYNDWTGQGASNACRACSSKTANCSTCNVATGACTGCNSNFVLKNNSCVSSGIQYTCNPSNACIQDTLPNGKKRIKITATSQFSVTQAPTNLVTIFAVGGGGGGCSHTYGRHGGGGYTQTVNTVLERKIYAVTIGAGGAGGAGRSSGRGVFNPGGTGGVTKFNENIVVAQGGGGGARDVDGVGGSEVLFEGEYYSGYMAGSPQADGYDAPNNSGKGGGQGWACCTDVTFAGGDGGSGIVIIISD